MDMFKVYLFFLTMGIMFSSQLLAEDTIFINHPDGLDVGAATWDDIMPSSERFSSEEPEGIPINNGISATALTFIVFSSEGIEKLCLPSGLHGTTKVGVCREPYIVIHVQKDYADSSLRTLLDTILTSLFSHYRASFIQCCYKLDGSELRISTRHESAPYHDCVCTTTLEVLVPEGVSVEFRKNLGIHFKTDSEYAFQWKAGLAGKESGWRRCKEKNTTVKSIIGRNSSIELALQYKFGEFFLLTTPVPSKPSGK